MFTNLIYVFINFVNIILLILQFAMLGRAILSWTSPDDENKLARFLFMVTEPVVAPVRKLISKIGYLNNLPIDVSFIAAFFVLWLLQTLLPSVTL